MGGPGSGSHYHWWRSRKKTTVEDGRSLDAIRWMREGILKPGIWHSGGWAWLSDEVRTEQTSALGYEVNTLSVSPWLRLTYTITRTKEALDYRLRLATTRPRFGGCGGGSFAPWWSMAGRAGGGWPSCTCLRAGATTHAGIAIA
jgi:hypothetical protein